MVDFAGDILVIERAFIPMEFGLGDIGNTCAIGQRHVIAMGAPGQEGGAKDRRQKFGQSATLADPVETRVCLGRMFVNIHNHLCQIKPIKKLVRLAGLEPAKGLFSSLLIIAFLCAILLIFIHGFPSYVNGYFASKSTYGQKNLCGLVRLCGKCAMAAAA